MKEMNQELKQKVGEALGDVLDLPDGVTSYVLMYSDGKKSYLLATDEVCVGYLSELNAWASMMVAKFLKDSKSE